MGIYKHCIRILGEIAESEGLIATGKGPCGRLRVYMPASIGRLLGIPRSPDFRDRYPEIDVVVGLGEEPVDLEQEGIDCAITVGPVRDANIVQINLGVLSMATAASLEYLDNHGEPLEIEELENHFAVQLFSRRTEKIAVFSFVVTGCATDVKMRSVLSISDADGYVISGVAGAGVIQAPLFIMAPYLY